MPLSAEQYNRMMRFLDGAMSVEEMDAFEKELNESPEIREQLDFEQSIRNSFSLKEASQLNEPVPDGNFSFEQQDMKKLPALIKWAGLAAAILAVVLFLPFLFRNLQNNSTESKDNLVKQQKIDSPPQVSGPAPAPVPAPTTVPPNSELLTQLFKQFYVKEPVPENYPVVLAEAFEDYEAGNYATFKKLSIDELPATRGSSDASLLPIAYYFKGLSHLQTGNVGEAIRNLNWVLSEQPDESLQEKAKWYLILCYLKENNHEKSSALCRDLKNTGKNPELVKKSMQVLEQLNNKK